MFSTAVCVLFLIKLRYNAPRTKVFMTLFSIISKNNKAATTRKDKLNYVAPEFTFPEKNHHYKGSFNLWSIRWEQYCPVSRARNSNKSRLNNVRITISNKFTFHSCKIFCTRCSQLNFILSLHSYYRIYRQKIAID